MLLPGRGAVSRQPCCRSSAGRELGQAVVRNHLLKKLRLSRPLLIPQPVGAKGVN